MTKLNFVRSADSRMVSFNIEMAELFLKHSKKLAPTLPPSSSSDHRNLSFS